MADLIRGDALQAQGQLDEFDVGPSVGVGDVFDRLWHLLISMRVGLTLILFLTFLSLVGTLVMQAPAGLSSDRDAYARWLTTLVPRYGGWTGVFDALGFYSVFGSIWFKVTVLLLTTSLLACSLNRAPRLWKAAVHPRVAASQGFLQNARLSGTVDSPAQARQAVAALEGELRRHHYRTIVAEDEAGVALYADRFRWGPFGTVVAHLSLITILGGAILGMTGFRVTDFAISVGSTVPVGNGTNLSVKANSFSDSYYDNGTPADFASDLVVFENGQQIAQKTIRVNDPLRVGEVTIFQSFYGPAADILVTDAAGATVVQDGVPLLWSSNDDRRAIGQFDIPGRGLTVYVVGVASGEVDPSIRPGQVQVEVYQAPGSGTPLGFQVVDQGSKATIAGLDFTFVRERQFTGLIVSKDPGAPLVWLGTILLTLGTLMVFLFPNRRIWARVSPTDAGVRVQVAAASRHDVSFESSFQTIVDDVRLALPASAS
jgi:cytochrome c biogenesis protein